jgi:serine/threonine-protein kinase HipA
MKNRCLYCYKELKSKADYHEKCSLSFFGQKVAPELPYSYNQMAELAINVVKRSIAVPGVQPKLSMSLLKETNQLTGGRLTIVGALGGNYIFKPQTDNFPEMPANEHLTMRIAESFAIRTVPSSLIRLQSGELSYITKRIDREPGGEKKHMLDMFQITEAFDKYKSSSEKIGKALNSYSSNTLLDKLFFFELTLFCFLTGNNDMHLKNFSMIETNNGWSLSPAYDLLNAAIVNPEDKEEMALTLNGRKNRLEKIDFEAFGDNLGLSPKQIASVFTRFYKLKSEALKWIEISFLSETMKLLYKEKMEEKFDRLY